MLKKKPEYLDYFVNGFEFSEKNHEFINKILNSDHYELRYYLGDLYYSIFEKIFEIYYPKGFTRFARVGSKRGNS